MHFSFPGHYLAFFKNSFFSSCHSFHENFLKEVVQSIHVMTRNIHSWDRLLEEKVSAHLPVASAFHDWHVLTAALTVKGRRK